MLRRRYRLVPGNDWWEDAAKVEALSALAAWVARYDSGQCDDPPGKLALLHHLERVRELVRGHEPFDPARDHAASPGSWLRKAAGAARRDAAARA
jgi:hypothetical protein